MRRKGLGRRTRIAVLFAASLAPRWVGEAVAQGALAYDVAPFRAAQARDESGPRDSRFDAAFDRAAQGLKGTDDPLGVDDLVLLRSLRAIAARESGEAARSGFVHARDLIARALVRRVGLSEGVAGALAEVVEAQASRAAGVQPAGGTSKGGPSNAAHRAAARKALAHTWATSRIERRYDVPYIAGYDREDGALVFIDCALPMTLRRRGRVIPVGQLLTLHERVEKAMLQEFSLSYPSAHQIALRIERLAAGAVGTPWRAYDAFIAQASERISARDQAHVSERLDLLPYYSFEDEDNLALVRRIEAGRRAHGDRVAPHGPRQSGAPACSWSGARG